MSAKLPQAPPADLPSRQPDWWLWGRDRPLWFIADGLGPYARPFGEMRSFGPLPTARFDPHPEPPAESSGEKVLYAAGDLLTAIAERYQRRRAVVLKEGTSPIVYSWSTRRDLRLIDLTGAGAVRLGASQALITGPRPVTRRWSRAIRAAWPQADGLRYRSSMTGHDCAVLWAPAADSFPEQPSLAVPISFPSQKLQALIQGACAELSYDYWP